MISRPTLAHRPPKHQVVGSAENTENCGSGPLTKLELQTIRSDLRLYEVAVPMEWIDYNGHMTEYRYLQVLGETTDKFLSHIGAGLDYVAAGHSYYTVETHIRHLREAKAGDLIHTNSQLLVVDAKRIHVFHTLINSSSGDVLATGEHLLLHVDVAAGKACPASPQVLEKLEHIFDTHKSSARPYGAGRHVAQKP